MPAPRSALGQATVMVCGAPAFVGSTALLVSQLGVDTSRVRRDRFYGYSPGHWRGGGRR